MDGWLDGWIYPRCCCSRFSRARLTEELRNWATERLSDSDVEPALRCAALRWAARERDRERERRTAAAAAAANLTTKERRTAAPLNDSTQLDWVAAAPCSTAPSYSAACSRGGSSCSGRRCEEAPRSPFTRSLAHSLTRSLAHSHRATSSWRDSSMIAAEWVSEWVSERGGKGGAEAKERKKSKKSPRWLTVNSDTKRNTFSPRDSG